MDDSLIRRSDAIDAICKTSCEITPQRCAELTNNRYCSLRKSLKELPSAEPPYQYSEAYVEQIRGERDILQDMVDNMAKPKTGWIPIKWHEITEEEREREGYPKDWVVHIDCDMPCDGDEILVQTKNGCIRWDVCYEEGGFSLDSGWDWIEDIVAWQNLPAPYKGGEE